MVGVGQKGSIFGRLPGLERLRKAFGMAKIGYMRVSTEEQRPDRQIEGLRSLCDQVHVETLSAAAKSRPIYDALRANLSTGDELIVWDLDRAYRTTPEALIEIAELAARGVAFRIANFPVLDHETPEGYFMLTMLSAVAEFERRLLVRRTKEGLAAARLRGVRLGRPLKLTDAQVCDARCRLASAEGVTISALAAELGVKRWTLSRALKRPIA